MHCDHVRLSTPRAPRHPGATGCLLSPFWSPPYVPDAPLAVSSLLGRSLCPYTSLLLSAFLLSQACFFVGVLLLHRLSLGVLQSARLSYLACVCFVCSPASVFHMAAYSEGVFTALSLAGMLARHQRRPALLVAALFAAATAARANGWVLAGFFAFDALHDSAQLLRDKSKSGGCLAGCFVRVAAVWTKAAVYAAIVGPSFCPTRHAASRAHPCQPRAPGVEHRPVSDARLQFGTRAAMAFCCCDSSGAQGFRTRCSSCIWQRVSARPRRCPARPCPRTAARSCRTSTRTSRQRTGQTSRRQAPAALRSARLLARSFGALSLFSCFLLIHSVCFLVCLVSLLSLCL